MPGADNVYMAKLAEQAERYEGAGCLLGSRLLASVNSRRLRPSALPSALPPLHPHGAWFPVNRDGGLHEERGPEL